MCRLYVGGKAIYEYSHQDNTAKKALKLSAYFMLKGFTELTPPWGSLTGVRPSKLARELTQKLGEETAKNVFIHEYDVSIKKTELAFEVMNNQRELIQSAKKNHLDIYIGIPFCPSRCTYCSFASNDLHKYGAYADTYVTRLMEEIRAFEMGQRTLRAVYIGGGTPSALSAKQLDLLLGTVAQKFAKPVEYTFEAGRSDTITKEKLSLLREYNITRLSINPQTLHDETLRAIGRSHTAGDVHRAFELARSMGFLNINADIIAGLPGENFLGHFKHTVEELTALGPEGITVHTLSKKRSSKLELVEVIEGEAKAMVEYCLERLKAKGYLPYYMYRQKYMSGNLENVGYAKEGHFCLYNTDIMEETVSIAAFGCGGISKRIFPNENRIERSANVSDLKHYLERTDEMIKRKFMLFL